MINGHNRPFEGKYDNLLTEKQAYYIDIIKSELGISFESKKATSLEAWYFIEEHCDKLGCKALRDEIYARYNDLIHSERIEFVDYPENPKKSRILDYDYDENDYDEINQVYLNK